VTSSAVAVIGMAGRFPGAAGVEALWRNLCDGVESICHFTPEELLVRGQDPTLVTDPRFVAAEGVLDDIERFDAAFFGYSPREAQVMDPQHRLCLEAAWEAFDRAGYDPAATGGEVGVFLSASVSSYLVRNLLPHRELQGLLGGFPLLIHNDKDFLATTVSYKLGLRGPSMAVGSACSSSLVAVHLACQSLLALESDMAIAGGVSLQVPQPQGYLYTDEGIYSPDGHCRAFDDRAAGTVGGSGVGVVLLKRWDDAVRDRDHVHAILLGSAVNNDGAAKVGYMAPSVDGQAAVIAEALEVAGISADEVGYIEAHGTGTSLGDPVEIDALTTAFRRGTTRRGFCAVGSIKTNIGHLDAAAGVASLIKTVLSVERATIPASLHFERPNAHLNLDTSPFSVAAATAPWTGNAPRTAGVNAFGIGGTNAHVVVRERPAPAARTGATRAWHPLVLSAREPAALDRASRNLAEHLRSQPDPDLADVAFTLAARRAFPHRRAVVCRDATSAATALESARTGETVAVATRSIVFLFPGQGALHEAALRELYRDEPTFRSHLDECASLLRPAGVDLHAAADTATSQPVLFAVEYAMARTLEDWGLTPHAMLGHSLGQYVAATLAGLFTLADALRLVTARGRLLAKLPPGRMLAVALPADDLRGILPASLACAADNGPAQCVVTGPPEDIAAFAAALADRGVDARLVPVAHAYHSAAVDPIIEPFLDAVREVTLHPPARPFLCNVTGEWATADEVTRPVYWARHLREPVRFGDGIRAVLALPDPLVLEVGPAAVLSPLVQRHPDRTATCVVLSCQPPARDEASRSGAFLAALAEAWTVGAPVRWDAFHAVTGGRRTPLPPYPFQRRRYWVPPPSPAGNRQLHVLVPFLRHRAATLAAARPVRGIDDYPGLRAALDRLCGALAWRYVSGADLTPGERYRISELRHRLGVLAEYEPFLSYMVDLLDTVGVVRRDGDEVRFQQPGADPEPLAEQLVADYPQFRGLVELLMHCGANYPRALADRGVAPGVLYPDAGGALLRRALDERTVEHTGIGGLVVLIAELTQHLAGAATRLRILEVGAGGGRLTWAIAQALEDRPAELLATDVSRAFVEHLSRDAAARGLDVVDTATLDLTQDPLKQGFTAQQFDVIVGLDVVHATPDILASLANLRTLLAPGGVLALAESTAADRWLSMIWGLSEQWWSFRDGLRDSQPLLTPDAWAAAVSAADFADTAVLPGEPDDSALILAQALPAAPQTAEAVPGELPPRRPDPGDWLYAPGWAHAAPPARRAAPAGRCLVFTDGAFGEAVADRFRAHAGDVMLVHPGPSFAQTGRCSWTVDPARPEDYRSLLSAAGAAVAHIAHLWGADAAPAAVTLDTLDEQQSRALHSLLFLAQAHGALPNRAACRILAVTAGAHEVLGGDLTHPEQAMLHAAVKVIPREYPDLTCAAVDLPAERSDAQDAWLADRVIDELLAVPDEVTVAYRGLRRWRPTFTRLPAAAARDPRPGGVYLVVGGLGGIGLALAEFLARTPATVVLTARTPFPDRADWPGITRAGPGHADAATIGRLLAAETAGGTIAVRQADITSLADMRAAVDETLAQFGTLTGVIHAAGVVDDAGMIQRRTRAATDEVIAAKVRGSLVLDQVLAGLDLDFLVLCSSLGPILYNLKFGEVGYVAGNEFLNAFAALRAARGHPETVAVSWTDWLEAGMWARARERLGRYELSDPDPPMAFRPAADLLRGITDAEGIQIFRRVLGHRASPHVVVSTQDLDALLAQHAAFTTDEHRRLVAQLRLPSQDQHRQRDPSEAPATTEESAIADMWSSLLGIASIGIADNFFELGGDSLLALRFLAMLRDRFGVELHVAQLFAAPTLRAMAAEVTGAAKAEEEVWL
jgi:acyl transferase domain-containing protein/2-polyprenyl-3-methyl-5-hydroxy-6-metoxy-1,4-benzoquinol methylase/aryl carrier-like protein